MKNGFSETTIVFLPGSSDHPVLNNINNDYPFPFLKQYHAFQKFLGHETGFLFEPTSGILVPIKLHRRYFFVFAQLLYSPFRQEKPILVEEEKEFWVNAETYLQSRFNIQRILPSQQFFNYSSPPENSLNCPLGIYSINLTSPEEEIFGKIQARTRKYIRGNSTKEITVRYGEECLPDFYSLLSKTLLREGAWCDSFENIKSFYHFLAPTNILCAVAYRGSSPEATLLVPYTNYLAFLYYGAAYENNAASTTNKFLHWEVMKKLKSEGVAKLILGGVRMGNVSGTKYERIQFFKERLGPEIVSGYIWKKDLKPVFAKTYDLIFNMRDFLKGTKTTPDVIDFYNLRKQQRNTEQGKNLIEQENE